MVNGLRYIASFIRLIYPRICAGCQEDLIQGEAFVCLHCQQAMVQTDHISRRDNPMFAMFRPVVPIEQAAAAYYYGSDVIIQRLMHELKYAGNIKLGRHLGVDLGNYLSGQPGWDNVDVLVPVPLHPRRQSVRGFNQSEVLCVGISEVIGMPVISDVLFRKISTPSQTDRSRIERWENVSEAFDLHDQQPLQGKHILLVDDVVTTGSTLLASALALLRIPNIRISIAALAYAGEL